MLLTISLAAIIDVCLCDKRCVSLNVLTNFVERAFHTYNCIHFYAIPL